MKAGSSCLLAVVLCLIGMTSAAAAETYEQLIERGDRLHEQNRNAEALEVFRKAERLREPDADLLRRIGRELSQSISDTDSVREKRRLARESVEFIERAHALSPNDPEVRLSRAIAYGRLALYEPNPGTRMRYSRLVRSEAEVAAELDPENDLAWHVLGRWNLEIATLNPALRLAAQTIYGRFPDASVEKAVEHLERAVRKGPPRVIHHVALGRAYLEAGENEKAKRQLERALSLPAREKDDPEAHQTAREVLASIRDEPE